MIVGTTGELPLAERRLRLEKETQLEQFCRWGDHTDQDAQLHDVRLGRVLARSTPKHDPRSERNGEEQYRGGNSYRIGISSEGQLLFSC